MTMWSELHEQAVVVERLVERLLEPSSAATRLLQTHRGLVLGVGRGTSDNALRYAQYAWGQRLRLPVALAVPALHSRYSAPPDLSGALIVGVSQSGRSPDLLAVLEDGRRQGCRILVVTNDPSSLMAEIADAVVDLAAGPELAVAATKTYTAQLAAVAGLASGERGSDEFRMVAGAIRSTLEDANRFAAAGRLLGSAARCMVVGRGMHFATAHEWALKLQELANIVAQPLSAADLRHGPIAAADEQLVALVVATEGPVIDDVREAAKELRHRGATVIAMTDDERFPADEVLLVQKSPEWLAPLVVAPAIQAFAHGAATARGLDPDSPRGLAKVTLTN